MRISAVFALLTLLNGSTNAFSPIGQSATMRSTTTMAMQKMDESNIASFDPLNLSSSEEESNATIFNSASTPAAASLAAALMMTPLEANAAGPDWGIFEGRIGSLLHPVIMGSMLLLSLSTGLKGFQYRRQRTIGDDISALKKTLPNLGGAKTVGDAIAVAEGAEVVDAALVSSLKSALPVQGEIDALVAERKELSSKGLRDGHFSQGATLAFLGTAFAIEGPLNTYARAGKLFPGPHLYAGAGLVVLWAAAAACVPAMQKGNDTARSLHIGANVAGTGLFAWQVVSGWPILLKVIEKTSWP